MVRSACIQCSVCSQRFLGLLAQLLPDLQLVEASWRGKRTEWTNGGCLILGQGLFAWMRQSLRARGISRLRQLHLASRPQLVAVWESWDEEPYHVGVRLGEYFLDGDGVQRCDSLLASWETYFRGGAYLAPLPAWAVTMYGFLVHQQLSARIALSLREEFGLFDPHNIPTESDARLISPCSLDRLFVRH